VTRAIIVASAVVGLSLLSYQARSETPDKIVWEQSGWQVAAMMNISGRFIGCYAVRDFLGTTGVRDRFGDDHRLVLPPWGSETATRRRARI
jgi:hypothetical protein